MVVSLYLSIIVWISTIYVTLEGTLEVRVSKKKKLFCDYCTRFSNDKNIAKVAEWLLDVRDQDYNGNIKDKCQTKKRLKGKHTEEPTRFEKERFREFLIELNIQIKNNQIDKEDARRIFSIYTDLYLDMLNADNKPYLKLVSQDISELCVNND